MSIKCDESYSPSPPPINRGGSGFHSSPVNREFSLSIREPSEYFPIICVCLKECFEITMSSLSVTTLFSSSGGSSRGRQCM